MNDLPWAAVVRLVHERADYTCEYCQTSQRVIGQAMHVEHIDPKGGDQPENLCLSCSSCNLSKARAVSASDPLTGQVVALFNPRRQLWSAHFQWVEDDQQVAGLTAAGRATVIRLKMNLPHLVEARSIWVMAGVHPPKIPNS